MSVTYRERYELRLARMLHRNVCCPGHTVAHSARAQRYIQIIIQKRACHKGRIPPLACLHSRISLIHSCNKFCEVLVYASRGGLRGVCRVGEVVAGVIREVIVRCKVEAKPSELHKIWGHRETAEKQEGYIENGQNRQNAQFP